MVAELRDYHVAQERDLALLVHTYRYPPHLPAVAARATLLCTCRSCRRSSGTPQLS